MGNKTLLSALIVFLIVQFTDLFSQNPRIDGYKGIWYSSGPLTDYGYRFSGGVATFDSRYRPVAIYSPEVKKTFFVYGGTTDANDRHLLIMVSYFDHKFHNVPKPVIVYDKMGVREPNDNASLSIDNKGYLWVFISGNGRTRPGLIFKSSEPYSIDRFDLQKECEMVSPQPWWIKGSGFLVMYSMAAKGLELYYSSSPDGKEWTEPQKLAGIGGHFQVTGLSGNKVMTAFTYYPYGKPDFRTGLYLLQTDDFGKTWKTIDNRFVKTPVTEIMNEALVRDYGSEGRHVYINDLNFDSEGNPVILVVLSKDPNPGPAGGPREWIVIYWKDQKWNFSKVCESTNNYDMGSIYIEKDEWKIIGPTEPGPQKYCTGGEVALWISKDSGASWSKLYNITSKSENNNSFVRRPLNAQKDFYAMWTDGDANKFSVSRLFYIGEKCRRVMTLPYDMTDNIEKPVRLR